MKRLYQKWLAEKSWRIRLHSKGINDLQWRLLIIRFSVLGLLLGAWLQENAVAQSQGLKFVHLSVKEGLSQSSVFSITQDHYGFMWFGTRTGGLNKYDGYTFTSYKHDQDDSCSISGNEITAVFEDSKGSLWVGTRSAGLNRFDANGNCFKRYSLSAQDKDNTVQQLFEDSQGRLWIANNLGLWQYHYDTDTFSKYLADPKGNSNIITSITEAEGNKLWIGTKKNGLGLFDPEKDACVYFKHDPNNPKSLSNNHVFAVLLDSKKRLWIGTKNKGISCMLSQNIGVFEHFKSNPQEPASLSSNITRTINEDAEGNIWVGTKNGLDQLTVAEQANEHPQFIHYRHHEYSEYSLSQNSIYSFYIDQRGSFWVGTWAGGVNYLNKDYFKFNHYNRQANNPLSLSNNAVSSFVQIGEDVWVGTQGGGLNLFKRKENKFLHHKSVVDQKYALNSHHIQTMYIDQDSSFWVGTFDGLYLFDVENNRFTPYLKGQSIYAITNGIEGELWVATSKKLCRLDKETETFKIYDSTSIIDKTKLATSAASTLFKDSKGKIWIGTKNGLHYYNRTEDNFSRYVHEDGRSSSISHNYITSIAEDKNGNLWVGTYDGLNKFDPSTEKFVWYGEKIGFPDNVINSILSDKNGCLWVASNKGISRFDLKALAIYESYQKEAINRNNTSHAIQLRNAIVKNYDVADGLQDNEFIVNACYRNAQGELFFGGINGFNVFNPAELKYNPHIPEVVITELKLFNEPIYAGDANSPLIQPIEETKKLQLTHEQSIFTLGFVALNYSSPEKNQYAYMMEGLDKHWNYIDDTREVTYNSLPPGNYTFRVKASNNDGIWNQEGASLQIAIMPPWWETLAFKVLIGLIALLMAISFYKYRVNALKTQKEKLEKEVETRTEELKEAVVELQERHEEIMRQNEEIQNQAEQLQAVNTNLASRKSEIEKAYNNTKILSDFGQKLTSSLDIENISDMVYHYLCSLMDASAFGIGLYNEKTEKIEFYHFIEMHQKLPSFIRGLESKNSLVSWCFNNQKPVFVNDFDTEYVNYLEEKPNNVTNRPPMSTMHIPLSVEDKKIGVVTISSYARNAYTDNDFVLLKTIASYLAIALDNAYAYRILKSKSHSIENSIKYAQTMQESILPSDSKLDNEFESFLIYRPKDIVSGDFYWTATVVDEENDQTFTFIAVVDCTGHGVPGAFMSIIGMTFLNEIIFAKKIYDLQTILVKLDKRIRRFLKQGKGNNDDGMDICLCRIEKQATQKSSKVHFSGAKRPLLYWDNHSKKLVNIKGTNKSVGGTEIASREFEVHQVEIAQGSTIYLTSDGYVDQCNPDREKIGSRRLYELLQEVGSQPLNMQQEILINALDNHQQGEEQRDDITILGVNI